MSAARSERNRGFVTRAGILCRRQQNQECNAVNLHISYRYTIYKTPAQCPPRGSQTTPRLLSSLIHSRGASPLSQSDSKTALHHLLKVKHPRASSPAPGGLSSPQNTLRARSTRGSTGATRSGCHRRPLATTIHPWIVRGEPLLVSPHHRDHSQKQSGRWKHAACCRLPHVLPERVSQRLSGASPAAPPPTRQPSVKSGPRHTRLRNEAENPSKSSVTDPAPPSYSTHSEMHEPGARPGGLTDAVGSLAAGGLRQAPARVGRPVLATVVRHVPCHNTTQSQSTPVSRPPHSQLSQSRTMKCRR
jgi:hypothetical protein